MVLDLRNYWNLKNMFEGLKFKKSGFLVKLLSRIISLFGSKVEKKPKIVSYNIILIV
jgi:hypothetical protein